MAAASNGAMIEPRVLKEPPKRPVRILDALAEAQKRDDISVIAERLSQLPLHRNLKDYADGKAVDRAQVVADITAMDGMVAVTIFNRTKLVGLLKTMLTEVARKAGEKNEVEVGAAAAGMIKILSEYDAPCRESRPDLACE